MLRRGPVGYVELLFALSITARAADDADVTIGVGIGGHEHIRTSLEDLRMEILQQLTGSFQRRRLVVVHMDTDVAVAHVCGNQVKGWLVALQRADGGY